MAEVTREEIQEALSIVDQCTLDPVFAETILAAAYREAIEALEEVTDLYAALFTDTVELDAERVVAIVGSRKIIAKAK